ncbi:MAG: hypothetical protein ACKVWV_11400 [Planctomycetota bacterium]
MRSTSVVLSLVATQLVCTAAALANPQSKDALRLGSPPVLTPGTTEEAMWPAASAEQWKRPCLVRWQRSFDDALRVARAERRPIMVAVNMDGEIASEHWAGVRYREIDTATMMARYACVIASVYRHTPRDYDENGVRVECPRFQTVTCGEHIEAERELYDKYFDGVRISPRHIVLDLELKETLDVYHSWDVATVTTTFRTGVEGWPEPIDPVEPTLQGITKSARVEDRETLERTYRDGDAAARRTILELLTKERVVDQVEVLRSAIFGLDLELARQARRALAQCETEGALDLMAEALKAPLEAPERELLLAAVERLGARSPRARTLAALHSGLSAGSQHVDTRALAKEYGARSIRGADVQASAAAVEARPNEPGALLAYAEALVADARSSTTSARTALLYEDARAAALEAETLGAKSVRTDALVAVCAAELGDFHTARARAVAAVEGGLLRPVTDATAAPSAESELDPTSRARVLKLFASARQRAIRDAFRAGEQWPPEWLSDVNAAHETLAESGLTTPESLGEHYDFLRWIGASARANTVLDDALQRFPDAAVLHERLRVRLLFEGGAERLEREYAARVAKASEDASTPSHITWYAGYASLVAAEHLRRESQFERAAAAYERAIASYQRSIELFPTERDGCLHYIALAHAGNARMALERGDLVSATSTLLSAFELRPESAASQDGLSITPIQTALMLRARLLDAGDAERAARVQAALDALDPKLLAPPPSELPSARARRTGPRSSTGNEPR